MERYIRNSIPFILSYFKSDILHKSIILWYDKLQEEIFERKGKKVNGMTNAEIREFKSYVRDTLVRKYHLNEVEAVRAVRDSYLSKALAMDKDFVDHDTVEEWAEFIYDEINHESLLMM